MRQIQLLWIEIKKLQWLACAGLCLTWFAAHSRADEQVRTWRNNTGTAEMRATLVKPGLRSVELKKEDGQVIIVPVDRLSEADRVYVKSRGPTNPFSLPGDPVPPRGKESLVMVVAKRQNQTTLYPGIVAKKDAAKAYVVAFGPIGLGTREKKMELETSQNVVWDTPQGRRVVPAEILASSNRNYTSLLAIPVADTPPALPLRNEPWKEGMTMQVSGYEVSRSNPTWFADCEGTAASKRIFQHQFGNNDPSRMFIEGTGLESFFGGLVFSQSGMPLGYIPRVERRPVFDGREVRQLPAELYVFELNRLSEIAKPEAVTRIIAPISGDADKVEYEVVIVYQDPFQRLRAPRLWVLPENPQTQPSLDFAKLQRVQGKFSDQAVGVKLAQGKPTISLPEQYDPALVPQYTTWHGRFSTKNLGTKSRNSFWAQTVTDNEQGEPVYQGISSIRLDGVDAINARHRQRGGDAPSNIPGLDGQPLEAVRPVKLAGGGWVLTSEQTKPKDRGRHTPRAPFPTPEKVGKPLDVKFSTIGSADVVEFDVSEQPKDLRERPRSSMAFSADGQWLYVRDFRDVLHKVSTTDFKVDTRLDLGLDDFKLSRGEDANQLAICKGGLLVSFRQAQVVWVVDPITLKVLREIPVEGLSGVVGSPATSIGFAAGRHTSTKNGTHRYPFFQMVNFQMGRTLQHIPFSGDGWSLRIEKEYLIKSRNDDLPFALSSNGKQLFVGTHALLRFRVESPDLIYEEASSPGKFRGSSDKVHGVIAGGDSHCAMLFGYSDNRGGYPLSVFSGNDLSKKKGEIKEAGFVCAAIFDAKKDSVYVPSGDKLRVCNLAGDTKEELQLGVSRIVAHPQGDRFLAWRGKKGYAYVDMVRGRIKVGKSP